jgi:CheY-like chemotaxis protein
LYSVDLRLERQHDYPGQKGLSLVRGTNEDKKIILVSDDDADDCLLIKDVLMDIGLECEVQFVSDGIELMEYLENCERQEGQAWRPLPDLIVLDLNMPRKGGREVLKEISLHSRFKTVPIVVLTTSDEPRDIALCSSLGAKLFITKPSMYNQWLERFESLKEFV